MATHSPGFVTPHTISNVTRIYQKEQISEKSSLNEDSLPDRKHLVHMVNSHNNERLFFADEVVLVEGISDRIIWSSLVHLYTRHHGINRTIEVVEVGGKYNFANYMDLSAGIRMPASVIADRDYLREIGGDEVKRLFKIDARKAGKKARDKKSWDGRSLVRAIDMAVEEDDLDGLNSVWQHFKNRCNSMIDDPDETAWNLIDAEIRSLRNQRTHVLRWGEIEDYLPTGVSGIEDIIDLIQDPEWPLQIPDMDRAEELKKIVCDVLGMNKSRIAMIDICGRVVTDGE